MTAIHYRTAKVDNRNVFYREAGSADAPKLLLLHGFPTVRFFDTGHFALETHAAEIAAAILEFFPR
jgi:hypothetical protein